MRVKQHDSYEVSPFYQDQGVITPGVKKYGLRPHARIRERGRAGLLRWMRTYSPKAYAKVKSRRPDLLSGGKLALGEMGAPPDINPHDDQSPATPSWSQQIIDLAKTALANEHEKDLLAIQVNAATEGKPPYDISNVQEYVAQVPTAMPRLLIPGLIGVAAVAFFMFGPKLIR